jgi:HK97 family phage major capsid protein
VNINSLKEKRAALIAKQREILDANKDASALSADQMESFEGMESEVRSIESRIKLEEQTAQREAEMADVVLKTEEAEHRGEITTESEEYRTAWMKRLCGEPMNAAEKRALSIGSAGAGGNLATTQVSQQISQLREEANFMRQIGTVTQVSQKTAFATDHEPSASGPDHEGF